MSDRTIDILVICGKTGAIVIIGMVLLKIILSILRKCLKKSSMDPMLHKFIVNGIKILLVAILIIITLESLGIKTASFLAVIGVAGAAIALALKDSLGNVAGGIMLLVTKPFSQNDYIDISGTTGTVMHIDLLLTSLKTFDNKIITIPNGVVTTAIITNYTKEKKRRVDCLVSVDYNSDYDKVKKLILEVADSCSMIDKEPEPFIGVSNNGESSVNLDFRVWCDAENYWDVKYFLEENIKISLDKAEINIPFPQLDVHIKK